MPPDRARERLVLVVDDDPDILQTLALCLSSEGYRVVMASNGQEALDVLGQQRPACILLDLMMPVMDGWTFRSEQMRDPQLARIPVVVISAYRDLSQQVKDLGLIGYLKKPLDLRKLLQIVQENCCTASAAANT